MSADALEAPSIDTVEAIDYWLQELPQAGAAPLGRVGPLDGPDQLRASAALHARGAHALVAAAEIEGTT